MTREPKEGEKVPSEMDRILSGIQLDVQVKGRINLDLTFTSDQFILLPREIQKMLLDQGTPIKKESRL